MRKLLLALLVLVAAGCGSRDLFTPQDVGLLVVDAVLLVGEGMPEIYLSRTLPPQQPVGVPAAEDVLATVRITSAAGDTVRYSMILDQPGHYVPYPQDQRLVEPRMQYDLFVETIHGEILTATTTTPGLIGPTDWLLLSEDGGTVVRELVDFDGGDPYTAPQNQLVYRTGLLEARFPDGEAVGFQILLESLDLDSPLVIDPDFFEEDDFEDLERVNTSPMFESPDKSARLPWFAIFYAGRHRVTIYAVDRNWNDLVRSTPELNDGGGAFGGNLGDNFERPLFHVEGGIGLFGSASRVRTGFFVIDDD